MKLTKCDICGTLEGGRYYQVTLPTLEKCELLSYKQDICENCIRKVAAFVAAEKNKHGMGVTRL